MNDMLTNPQPNLLARVGVASPDTGSIGLDCGTVPPDDPCMLVIMGASGDLTARKLIPSLFHMYRNDRLPATFALSLIHISEPTRQLTQSRIPSYA